VEAVGDTPLRRSLAIQLRVIEALVRREIITRYGRHNIGFLWLFVEPMMFTLGITLIWSATRMTHGFNVPIVTFAVTGYSTILLWRNGVGRSTKAIEPNLALMYHRNVLVFDLFASRVILEMAGATISLILLTLVFSAIGLMHLPSDPLTALLAWGLLVWFSGALALAVGALAERYETVDRIWHPIAYFMLPVSGAFFMLDWLPTSAQKTLIWIPLVNGVEMLRHGYFGDAVRTYEDPALLVLINLPLTLLGLALVQHTARHVEPE
jgi:capsular polysaccharide transport system permease protein